MEGITKKSFSDENSENSNKTTQKKSSSFKKDFLEKNKELEELNPLEKNTQINSVLNQISSYYNNLPLRNNKNLIIFECPKEKCPYIPLLKYYEYTQTVSSICREGHQYHIPLCEYFQKILKNLNKENYCFECMKKNLDLNKKMPEFYCIDCTNFLCKNCQMKHYKTHKIFEVTKINTCCHIHEKTKFSGFCRSCKKDLCIHCIKDHDHGKGHHSLVKYMVLIPSKDKINKYKQQIKDEMIYIEKIKKILLEENIVKDQNIKNILDEFFDRMKLKYYFYDIQLQTFDKIKFNINIIKNVTDLFLVRQQTFEGIYNPIQANFGENKLEILNRILSIVLKYQISNNNNNNDKINKNLSQINKESYLTHFKFNHIFSLNQKKNVRFLYLLKSGKFIIYSDNDGIYIYDDGTYKELLHIPSEIEIIDLCENDTGLIFLLKKSMIEIIRLEENYMDYNTENKILFKTIDQVNFITCLENGTIVVSRTKRTEGNLDIWMKSKFKNDNNNGNNNDGKDNNNNNNRNDRNNNNLRNVIFAPDRRRNMINIVNNNLRLGFMLRTTRHNFNNYFQNNLMNNFGNIGNNLINNINVNQNQNNNNEENNNNENDDDDDDDDNDNDENNENNEENNNNDDNNNDNNDFQIDNLADHNANNENNNNINVNNENNNNSNNNSINNNSNDNILLQEIPDLLPNNNNNNILNNNIINNNLLIPNNVNQINYNNNIQNNNNNNNNNNYFNIIRPRRHVRNLPPRPRPRFVHVIRFIRDQLQGLVHNLEQEELVFEDPSLISSVGIYGSKDTEITHINKPMKKWTEIIALVDWNEEYFICAEFYIDKKDFKAVRIYSKETYEPIKKKSKLRAKYCMKDKNCLIKLSNDLLGVCYIRDDIEYGISLVSFKNRDEVTRYELPKFNCAKNILLKNSNYLFVFCKELFDKNDDVIKVLKIQDRELINSSNYFYEEFLNTYVYNNKKKSCLKDDENDIKEQNYDINININNFEQGDMLDEKEMNTIVSMIKLNNDTFVCLNRDNTINFYKVE